MDYRKNWKKRSISVALSAAMVTNMAAVIPAAAIEEFKENDEIIQSLKKQAAHKEAFDYALITGNTNTTLEMNAQKIDITGDVHSNSNFIYRGSEIVINGACEASKNTTISVSDSEYLDKIYSVDDDTELVSVPDYSEEIHAHLLEQNVPEYYDWTSFSDRYVDISNGICIDGTLGVYSSQFTGNGIIYAKNSINYSVGEISSADGGMVVLCAANGDINIYASNTTINGIIYAPHGTVTITGQNVTINGRIISDKFNFWGSNLTINKGEGDLDLLDFLFLPAPEISSDGEFKENRKVTFDISQTEKIDKAAKEETVWTFSRVDGETKTEAVQGEDYVIDESSSDGFIKNMIFKKYGTYEVSVTVRSGDSEKTSLQTIEVIPDVAPIVDFTLDNDYYYRDPENGSKASIPLKDHSYSVDNDEIGQRIWTVYYDADNNGVFDESEGEIISDSNESELTYTTGKVGKYKVELTSVETFSDTIPSLITQDDYRRADTGDKSIESKTFTVGNIAPEASVDVGLAKDVDLVFTVGSADVDKIQLYADRIEQIKAELEEQGYNVYLSTVSTSSLTAKDTFAWDEYDHYDYQDWYNIKRPKHIIYDDDNIQMVGYCWQALRDFLYVEDKNESQKIFTFDIQRDKTDWHSMEGGGFLFNTSIEDGVIKGFYVLITRSGLQLSQIKGLSVEDFQNGKRNSITALKTFKLDNLYDEHNIKIVVDKKSLSVWDGEKLVIDSYSLPENDYGYGYGPITSHASHGCTQQSYFTFANIKMQTISGEKLSDVLANYDWKSKTSRYVINLSDSELDEFETDEELAAVSKQILENELNFIGIGNGENSAQYTDIINSAAGSGIYLDAEDTDNSPENLSNYVVSNENSKNFSVDYYVAKDQPIRYIDSYKDHEKDPMYSESWEYEYDPSVFYNESGSTEVKKFSSDKAITDFEEAGAYTMRLKVRDNPVGDNDSLDEYRLWSGEKSYEKVLMVHNRPVAELTVNVSENPNDKNTVIINTQDNCYDKDHISDADKGIVSKSYKWKKLYDAEWTDGPIPNKVEIGGIYLICLTAVDKEGQISYPNIQIINTEDFLVPEEEEDKEPPVIELELEKTKVNAGESVKITAYASDNIGVDTFELYIDGERVLDHAGRIFYTGDKTETVEIKAIAVDINGNRSEETQQLTIVDNRDKTAPTVEIESPDDFSVMDFSVQFVGSAYDDTLLKNYRLEYRRQGAGSFNVIAESDHEVKSGILGEWNVEGLESGIYEVKLSAEDGAGNSSYVIYQYELKPNKESGIVDTETVDHEAPVIILTSSKDKADVGEEVKVTVDVKEESKIDAIQVYIDDELIMDSSGEITFSRGEPVVSKIKVYASDEFGNTSVKELSVIFVDDSDYDPPVTKIDTPEHASTISGSVDITGTAADETELLRYRLEYKAQNEESYTVFAEMYNQVENGTLGTFNTSALADGVYDIRLTAEDKSGNSSYVQYSYIVYKSENNNNDEDIVKPVIDLVLTKTEADIGEEVTGIVSVTDNKKLEAVKVYLDDEIILTSSGSFTFTRGKAAAAKIKVYAVDSAGNMATETAECVFIDNSDKKAPNAKISSPKHASEVSGKVDIKGTAKDDEELLRYTLGYRLSGTDDVIIFAEKTEAVDNDILGTLNTEKLVNGVYDIILTVEDKGGNKTIAQISYIVNNEQEGTGLIETDDDRLSSARLDIIDPVIKLALSKNVAGIGDKVKASFTVTDNKKVSSIKVYVDGKETEYKNNQVEFTSNKVGKIEVKVVAVDSSGNKAEKKAVCSFYNLSDNTPPELDIVSPEYYETVEKPTDIIGSVYDETELAYYKVEYRPKGAEKYTTLKKSTEEKHNESLAYFDTTVLANGIYEFKVTAEDFGGNTTTCEFQYVVDGTLKVGNTNLGFEDINTKISGLGVSVARYYSSSNKLSGDFGTGWTLGLGGIRLYEMSNIAEGWEQQYDRQTGNFLSTVYTVSELVSHDVVITYGDGTCERFKVKLDPASHSFVPLQNTSIKFESPTGSKNKLEVYGKNKVYLDGYLGETELLDYNTDKFVVQKYKLTLEDETEVIIDRDKGVESITDKFGNTIKVTENGYTDPNSVGLTFERDPHGRLTSVTEPDGKTTKYTYDENDDLIKVTDPMGYSVRYVYDSEHNLISMIDSRGVEAAHNEYDESGRLVATVDANGNRMIYEHDVDGRTEIVTDKLGNKSVYVYDDKGNVLKCTDANGNTTYAEYDKYGHIKSSTDALGNVTQYQMTATGEVLSLTNAVGNTVTNSYNDKKQLTSVTAMGVTQMIVNYDEDGLLTSTKDAMGNGTYYDYDSSYRIKGISDEIGSFINFTYDSKGNVISSTDGAGETATFTYDDSDNCISKTVVKTTEKGSENITENYEYDAMNRLVKVIYADGSVTSVSYDGNGNMTSAVDEKGRKTSYVYDNNCNLVKITYCDNTSESFGYDAEGRNTTATDRMGRTITMTYDKVGNLLTKTYPNGISESYSYDAKYRLTSVTDVNGGTTSYEYDEIDRNTAIVDALGNRTEFAYNSNSMLSSMTDPKGHVWKYEYDANGNRTKVIMPDCTSISSEYDARGRVTKQTDQNGYSTSYAYDGADRLVSVTDAAGSKWVYTYSGVGELTSVTDANGNTTSYEYDNMGRVIKTTNAAGKTAECTYDDSGNVLTSTNYSGTTTTYTYDNLDRLIKQDIDGDVTEFAYTSGGLLSSVTDSTGTISYTYNNTDGLSKVKLADGTEIKYSYYKSGNLKTVSTAYGDTTYGYDKMDRLTRVVDKNGVATLYEYDANGNRTAVKYANGITTTFVYNDVNQLISEKTVDKDSNVVVQYIYTLGKAGERLKVTEPDKVTEYGYDDLYRLTSEKVTKNKKTTTTTYTYDKVGNRLNKTENGTTNKYKYNSLNQLVSESGVTNSYDDNGNLIKQTENGKTTTYTFDKQNRLIRATISSGQNVTVEEYKYDYAGNRTAKITEGETTNYVVDTNGALAQVLYETDGTGSLKTYYTRGNELISLQREDEERYYLYDGHGSVRTLTDETGAVTDTYDYDAFGNLTDHSGETENSYLYCGEQYDANTGFYYLRARYMKPSTGTFISMDSYQGSMFDPVSLHKYLYANANPVMNSDPTGYSTVGEQGICGAIQAQLDKILTPNFIKVFNRINDIATIIDTVKQVTMILTDPDLSAWQVVEALGRGVVTSLFINHMCAMKRWGPIISKLFTAYGLVSQWDTIVEAAKNHDWLTVGTASVQLIMQLITMHQNCFTGDTLVAAEDGQKRIDEIKVGDKVWAYNVETGETELKGVKQVYIHETDELLHLYTSVGTIDTTSNHPFYVLGEGWVAAGDLAVGDEIYQLDGSIAVVTGSQFEKLDVPVKVYNLEVEGFHTYFVSESRVLVHNTYETENEDLDDAFRYGSRNSHKSDQKQAHHISQDAAFNSVIPTKEGLTVNLSGNIRLNIGSPHYKAHETLEAFWSDYRSGGKFEGTKPTVGQYNRAAYNSLINAGISIKQAAHYIRQAYDQQRKYGLTNTSQVPKVPGKIPLPK